ncbi:hypothetical protein F4604DRAFT_1756057 [Suillus subluteus]|nr:hypothetical protein F4604DRAFT_1756057 [Suillus subluteus]
MSYPYYQSTLNGWGSNQLQFGRPPPIQFQPQPSWGGYDYFRAHAPHIDPTIFNEVYGRMFNADVAPVGVGINEARIWHRRGYGGLCAISALSPQEIGYASAYEAYRFWIHNIALYEPFGAEIERQKEAFTGLAIAEAIKMYMISNPADTDYYIPACEAAAATALHIFDENSSGSSRGDIGAGMGYDTGMDIGAYDSGFGTPGMAGSGMAGVIGVIDPHAIDYDAPYLRQKTGRHRRLSMSAPHSAAGAYSPRAGSVMGGIGSSPYLGTAPSMGMGANPTIYGGGSPLVGGNGMGVTGTHGGVYPAYGAGSSVYGGASPVHAPPIYGASSPYTNTPNVTTVSAYPGTTTVIQLPRRRHRSSSKHHNRRARSAEPGMIAYTDAMGGPTSNHAMAVGGLTQGAVGGFTRGAMGGASIGASSPMGGGVGGFYGGPNKGYGYPGHKSMYRY